MSKRIVSAVVATAVLATAGFWHFSPYLTMHQMHTAAKALDAEAFNEHVDYPRLRTNLKAEMLAQFTPKTGAVTAGSKLGEMMVSGIVDAMVRPEVVMQAMKYGKLNVGPGAKAPPASEDEKADWTSDREGINTFVLYVGKTGEDPAKRIGLVLERSGFANWKLSGVRLPAKNF